MFMFSVVLYDFLGLPAETRDESQVHQMTTQITYTRSCGLHGAKRKRSLSHFLLFYGQRNNDDVQFF